MLGDGQELDQISSSLTETIDAYNKNFNQFEKLNNTIVVRYNEITGKMNDLTVHEHLLRDLLIGVQIENQLSLKRQVFLNIKSQHLNAIRELIKKSNLHESSDFIGRSIFHQNICSIEVC